MISFDVVSLFTAIPVDKAWCLIMFHDLIHYYFTGFLRLFQILQYIYTFT
jgi:hypothetical protein